MKTQLKKFITANVWMRTMMVILAISLFNTTQGQITQVGTTQSGYQIASSITLNKPTGVAVGDVMIVNIVKYSGGNTTAPSLSGWTAVSEALGGSTDIIGTILYKVVDGTEPSSFTFGLSNVSNVEASIVAFTNVDATSPFDVIPGAITTNNEPGTSINPTSITTVSPNALVIMAGMSYSSAYSTRNFNSWTATSPATLTELYEADGYFYASVGAATEIKSTAGATGTGTITVSGASSLGGVIFALKPKKDFKSVATGNWNSISTWQQSTDAGASWQAATTTPTNKDGDVTISDENTVTLSAAATASNVIVDGILTVSTYTLTGTNTLTINNGGTLSIGGGNNFPSGFATKTLSTGSTVNYYGAAQTISPVVYSNLSLSGSGTPSMSGVTTVNGNLALSGSVTATPVITTIGGNVSLTGTSTLTTGAALSIGGNITVGNGTTFTAAGYNLTVNGSTTVGAGASGRITISSINGTKIFAGLITVNSGATWNNSSNEAITCRGGITNNGTFTAGTGIYTFDTNSQTVAGTLSIGNVSVTTIALTNNNTLTVGTALAGTGSLIQTANASLTIGGTAAITTITATNSGNTITYSGAAQTVHINTYYNLAFSGSGNKSISNTIAINNNLSISGTAIALIASGKTCTALTLTLAAVNRTTGSWGGTGSSASNKNATYFGSSTTGILNVNISCVAGTWLGSFSSNWSDVGNWCSGVPASGANIIIPSGTNFQPIINSAVTCNNLTLNAGASLTITGTNTLTVNGILTTGVSSTLDLGVNKISGTFTNIVNNGTIKTQNISTTPLPSGRTWGGTINYNAATGGQTVMTGTYNNLTTGNTSGTQTVSGTLTVNNSLTTTTGSTLDLVATQLLGTLTDISNDGTIKTQNTSTTSLPSGKTWDGTVTYNATAGTQTIVAGTYNNLTIANTSGTQNAGGNLVVNGVLSNSSSILDLLTYQLSGSLTAIINNGEIRTANMSAQPVPSGKTWNGIITYYGGTPSATQTVVGGTYKIGQTGISIANGNYAANGDINIYDSTGCRFDNGGAANISSILDMGETYTFNRLGTGLGKITNNGATIKFKGATNGVAGFTSGTVEYCGTIDQTIGGDAINYTYGYLTLSGSGKKSLNSNIWVKRDWVRSGAATFDPQTYKVVFQGDNNDNYDAVITAPKSNERNEYGAFGGETFYAIEINKNSNTTTVSNGTGVNISVLYSLTLTKGILNIGDSNIVLVSNKSNTASLNQINSAHASINYGSTGRFIAQRFIDNASSSIRTWRMLSAPLQKTENISISQAWQEGTECNNFANPGAYNPWPGYGTQITGPKGYTAGNGFDQGSGSSTYSIKYYNSATGTWAYPSNTNKTALMSQTGWALFVRGDRGFGIANSYTAPTNTVLEPKGKVNTGDVTVDVVKGKFNLIGNPYPSQINMANVTIGGKANGWYELWDPKAFSNYSKTGKYIPFVWDAGAAAYVQANSPVTKWTPGTVESGVAIFVNPGGTQVIFHESDKVTNSNSLNGIQSRPGVNTSSSFRCDLAFYDTTAISNYSYIDGTVNLYHSSYSSAVDQFEDVVAAISNTTTGALRIAKDGSQLSVSKEEPMPTNDTIFLNISKLMQMHHRLAFSSKNIDARNVQAFAVDSYLGTTTPLVLNNTDSTYLDFDITTDPLSNSMNRFMVVFKTTNTTPLAVSFTSVNAVQQQNKIAIQWKVATETNVKQYEVERSADGINFVKVGETNMSIHNWLDATPLQGNNYYRIKCTFISEQAKYSTIVKVTSDKVASTIELLSNPVRNSMINFQFNNQTKGAYTVNVYNEIGQQVQTAKLSYEGGNGSQSVLVPTSLPKGIYQLEVITPANERIAKKVMVN